ncbi:hypothetical protein [Actinoplanes sp. NPDC051851]|uniref:hypothetical protein n=1 Tax=Actinoplanes sp. NPDC051851 TaxID=3154753 RepID=UPI003423610D
MAVEAFAGTTRPAARTDHSTTWNKRSIIWGRRAGLGAVAAALAMATVLGPGTPAATRLGASESVGFATVSAVDTMWSSAILADVPARLRET